MVHLIEMAPSGEPDYMLRGELDLGDQISMEYWLDPDRSSDWRIELHVRQFPTTEKELYTLLAAFSVAQGQTMKEALQAIRDFSEPHETVEQI